jgi:hypothetical protein
MIVLKRLCRPLANNRVHHQPDVEHRPNSRLEAAYHRADKTIQSVVLSANLILVQSQRFERGHARRNSAPTEPDQAAENNNRVPCTGCRLAKEFLRRKCMAAKRRCCA